MDRIKTTSPILSNAVAVFDCRVVETYKQGTHFIIIGQVVASKKGIGDPLIYSQRSYTHLKKIIIPMSIKYID